MKQDERSPLKGTVCIIDDEPDMVQTCADILRAQGWEVFPYSAAEQGLAAATSREFDLLIVDLMMPGIGGLQILKETRRASPWTVIVVITGYPTIETAVSSMRDGAFDYIVKPFMANHLVTLVERAMNVRRLESENASLKHKLTGAPLAHPFIGVSPSIQDVIVIIGKVAPLQSSILITGASGTGKELVAKSIHLHSNRRDQPFVPINCSALPEALLESELFGYEKGAFSGALARNIGLFEFADHGTLFLDEIGELPMSLQAKLLRVLQEREIRRVGGKEQIPVDVRIIAATNQDLEKMIRENRFREDLFFRLNVIGVKIPPLRERRMDIPLLAQHFLDQFNARHMKSIRLAPETIEHMVHYAWPGVFPRLRKC